MKKRPIQYIVISIYFSFLLALLLYKAYSATERSYSINLYFPYGKQNFVPSKLNSSENKKNRMSISGIAKKGAYLTISIEAAGKPIYDFPFFYVVSDNGWFNQQIYFPAELKTGNYTLIVRSLDGSTEVRREIKYELPTMPTMKNKVDSSSPAVEKSDVEKSDVEKPDIKKPDVKKTDVKKIVENMQGRTLELSQIEAKTSAANNESSEISISGSQSRLQSKIQNGSQSELPSESSSESSSELRPETSKNLTVKTESAQQILEISQKVEGGERKAEAEAQETEIKSPKDDSTPNSEPILKMWAEIKVLCDSKKYDEALKKLSEIEKDLVESPNILLYKGIIHYLQARQLEKAEYRIADKQYEKAILSLQEAYRKRAKFSEPNADVHYVRFYLAMSRYMRLRLARTLEMTDIEQQKYRIEAEEAFRKYFLYEKDKNSTTPYNKLWLEASKTYDEMKRY